MSSMCFSPLHAEMRNRDTSKSERSFVHLLQLQLPLLLLLLLFEATRKKIKSVLNGGLLCWQQSEALLQCHTLP